MTFRGKQQLSRTDKLVIQRSCKHIQELNVEFKCYHYAIIKQREDKRELEEKQEMLDDHDDKIIEFMDCLQAFVSNDADGPVETAMNVSSMTLQLDCLMCKVLRAQESVDAIQLGADVDCCLLHQLELQITGLPHKLSELGKEVTLFIEGCASLMEYEDTLDNLFSSSAYGSRGC